MKGQILSDPPHMRYLEELKQRDRKQNEDDNGWGWVSECT